MNDSLLEQKIKVLQSSITTWAQNNKVWGDKNLYSIWDGKPVYYDRFD